MKINVNGKQRDFDLDDPQLPDWIGDGAFSSGAYPYKKRLKRKDYERELDAKFPEKE